MVLKIHCPLTRSSSALDAWGRDGLLMTKEEEMNVAFEKLLAVIYLFYLGTCFLLEVAAS